jgi:large subunit ribosomal protein L7/L12
MMSEIAQQVHALDEDGQIETIATIIEGIELGTCVKLVKALEERWDVQATPNFGTAAMPGPAVEEEEAEQSEFTVVLKDNGAKKIQVIKAIRSLTQMDLKASKGLTESLPSTVKEGLSKDEAERYKSQLEEAGATVELK